MAIVSVEDKLQALQESLTQVRTFCMRLEQEHKDIKDCIKDAMDGLAGKEGINASFCHFVANHIGEDIAQLFLEKMFMKPEMYCFQYGTLTPMGTMFVNAMAAAVTKSLGFEPMSKSGSVINFRVSKCIDFSEEAALAVKERIEETVIDDIAKLKKQVKNLNKEIEKLSWEARR